MKRPLAVLCAFALLLPVTAHADVTSWMAVGGGAAVEKGQGSGREAHAVLSASLGVGTDPNRAWSVGGLFRSTTYFGLGTELAIGPRLASSGFNRGDFGVAVDVGVAGRFFRDSAYGRVPVQAGVTLGMPFGVQAELGVRAFDLSGKPSAQGVFVAVGIDLLRLTIHRRGPLSTKLWPNPAPAGTEPMAVNELPGERSGAPQDLEPEDASEFGGGVGVGGVRSPAPPARPPATAPDDDGEEVPAKPPPAVDDELK